MPEDIPPNVYNLLRLALVMSAVALVLAASVAIYCVGGEVPTIDLSPAISAKAP